MYPYPVFLGLTIYDLLLCAGIVLCFVLFGHFADKYRIKRSIQNFAIMCGVAAVVLGYGSAVLFQAFYNIGTLGRFEITESTGATFYGGLIGGVAVFLALYFGLGALRRDKRELAPAFFPIANCAVSGIALAHSLGRIGCLTSGCCHGDLTDAWYGIEMHGNFGFAKYVPVQLFEAIFLAALFVCLVLRARAKKGYVLPIYLIAYGVWRFFAEFLRRDYRGTTIVSYLSPSQLTAIILVGVGVGVIFLERYLNKYFASREVNDSTEAVHK